MPDKRSRAILATSLILAGFVLSCCNPERFAERMFEGVLEGLLQGLLGEEVEDVEIDLYPEGRDAKLPKDFPDELAYPGSMPFASFSLVAESGEYSGMFLNLDSPIADAVAYYEGLSGWEVEVEIDTTVTEVPVDSAEVTDESDAETVTNVSVSADIRMIRISGKDELWADVFGEQSDPASGSLIILYGEGRKPESLEL